MKIKNLAKSVGAIILGATMSASAFAFTACGPEGEHTEHIWGAGYEKDGANGHYQICTECDEHSETQPHEYTDDNDKDCNVCGYVRKIGEDIDIDDPTKATISVTADKTSIKAGTNETVKATVTIEGLTDKSVVWSLEGDGKSYVDISQDGVLTLKSGLTPHLNQIVKIVATSTVSSLVTDSVNVLIEAPVIEGQVGELTTDMLKALGNPEITVTGEVVDIYDDFNNDKNDKANKYDYTVMMADGAWYGSWNRKGSKDVDISNYRRAENGDTFNEVYIDKDNKIASKPVTDYQSNEASWEDQHMYNHLGDLGNDIENFWEYDALNKVYVYKSANTEADLYLRTYLAYSLTPMLTGSDTLDYIALTIEDGAITKLEARTYTQYYGSDKEGSSENATAMSYTTLSAVFTDVGNTDVPDPVPYVADKHADALASAIENMGNAKNYTFKAVENTLSAPSIDDGDYSIDSLSADSSAAVKRARVNNYVSATGTEGLVGYVTEDAVLLARTGKYSSSMDDNIYHTEYSGYKKSADDADTFDHFEYDSDAKTLVGDRQYKGDMFEKIMPKFEFSANMFKFAGMSEVEVNDEWVSLYNFTLREPAVTRDIALQLSAHSYAVDAEGSTYGTLKISVLGDGADARIISSEYPYSLISGTYIGTIKTTYSNIGSTELDADTFDGYQARVIHDNWSQYKVRYYHPDHNTHSPYGDIDCETLFKNIFGADAVLPSPLAFYEVFEDTMSGPFFDWKVKDNTATGGQKEYLDYVSFTFMVDECDENYVISKAQYDAIISNLTDVLKEYGYNMSGGNTTGYGSRSFATYINAEYGIVIRVENIRSRFFYVNVMPLSMLTDKD